SAELEREEHGEGRDDREVESHRHRLEEPRDATTYLEVQRRGADREDGGQEPRNRLVPVRVVARERDLQHREWDCREPHDRDPPLERAPFGHARSAIRASAQRACSATSWSSPAAARSSAATWSARPTFPS